jgi:hypothetical protein
MIGSAEPMKTEGLLSTSPIGKPHRPLHVSDEIAQITHSRVRRASYAFKCA